MCLEINVFFNIAPQLADFEPKCMDINIKVTMKSKSFAAFSINDFNDCTSYIYF